MPIGLDRLSFNQDGGANYFFGKTKAVAVWKEALSDQELADLTYPTPTDPTFALDFDTIATDFTFARGSEATYVDAQGLIQSTNELGPELVTNGNFSSDTDWLKGPGWSISGGIATLDVRYGGSSGLGSTSMSVTPGKTYKVVVNVISRSSGFRLYDNNGVIAYGLNVGENVFFRTVTSSSYQVTPLGLSGSTGSIDSVSVKEYTTATNTPRLDYSTGAEAFLLEPQSTNLITYSEDFSQWNETGVINTDNEIVSPDGTLNASLITEDATLNSKYTFLNLSISTNEHALSFFAKYKGRYLQVLFGTSDVSGNPYINFDLQNGTFENNGIINPSIEDFGNGWYKISLQVTPLVTSNFGVLFSPVPLLTSSRLTSYQGDGTSGIYIWGAQLEQQSYATSYIPTSGTSVTRNQETCINATPEINSEEGVLYFEGSALSDDGTVRSIALSDGTGVNRINIRFRSQSNEVEYSLFVNGETTKTITHNVSDTTNFHKMAALYKEDDLKFYVNGFLVGSFVSANMLPTNTLNQLNFNSGAGLSDFYGNTKDLQVYTKALSDAELIKLTSWTSFIEMANALNYNII